MKFSKNRIVITISLLIFLSIANTISARAATNIAFPGAEGFGAPAKGGRGGSVIQVTNLNDSGAGSLRACLLASGPRTCIFKVGGIIQIETPLVINNPYITIAGQTAPGGGITIRTKNDPGCNNDTMMQIGTNDVIIRYLTLRHGFKPSGCDAGYDAINLRNASANNIIADHLSLSWTTDEQFSSYAAGSSAFPHDFTVQWSMLYEGILPRSRGVLLGYANNMSLHHNLFAHSDQRNPRCQSGNFDFVNNLIYNYGNGAGWCDGKHGSPNVNFVNNYYKAGQSSDMGQEALKTDSSVTVYNSGNIITSGASLLTSGSKTSNTRFNYPQVTTTSAQQAMTDVLSRAGNAYGLDANGNLYSRRDSSDQRIISDVQNGTGTIKTAVPTFPTISNGTPYTDNDADGMSDTWESAKGVSNGNGDDDADGYTNLEEFLNATNPKSADNSVINPTVPAPTGSSTPIPTPTPLPSTTGTITPTPTGSTSPTPIPTNTSVNINVINATSSNTNYDPKETLDKDISKDSKWLVDNLAGWIKYELSSVSNITGVKFVFYNKDIRKYTFDIQISTDGVTWTNALTNQTSFEKNGSWETFTFDKTYSGKFIKVIGKGSNVSDWFGINEFEVIGGSSAPNTVPTPIPTPNPEATCKDKLFDIEYHGMAKYICKAKELGIINGFSNGTFQPDAGATRGQIAVIIVRAFGLSTDISNVSLKDIPNKTYEDNKSVLTLVALGIVNGYSDGTFQKDKIVTRGELSKMIINTLKYKQVYTSCSTSHTFGDIDNSAFRTHIACLASLSAGGEFIIKGYSPVNGVVHFKPGEPVTRAQVAKIIYIARQIGS